VKDPIFAANFMQDFVKELPPEHGKVKFEQVDFSELYALVDEEKRRKEATGKERKKQEAAERKARKEEQKQTYGHAVIDGKDVEIANWMVEPPGLFLGRGNHPIRGHWKPRVTHKDIILNLGDEATPPPGEWGKIVHDHESVWFAKWIDKLTDKEKYVWPHESSHIQQSRNMEKYDKAARMRKNLDKIRYRTLKSMSSKDLMERKTATVCYLIDWLGMRVGDEKDEDEADTVGATTLRVEHLKISDTKIEFDFLGKDSVRWIKVLENPEKVLVKNLTEFVSKKGIDDEVFDDITSGMVNSFFSSIVAGLSAKVFRTYHATAITEGYLRLADVTKEDDLVKKYHAKMANLEAAIFCNHKRTPPKNWEEALKKKEEQLKEYESKGKDERVKKVKMDIQLAVKTRDYNLNTSLKNYIDPRIYKAWCDYVGLDWTKLYTKSLQRKFEWVEKSRTEWVAAKETVPILPANVEAKA
jgi:DNA topoisomerase-1